MKRFCFLFMPVALLLSCHSVDTFFKQREPDASTLVGKIYDGNNQCCSGVKVTLEQGKPLESPASAITDVTGSFYFPVRPFGTYRVTARKDGFREEVLSLELNQVDQTLYLVMYNGAQLINRAEDFIEAKQYDKADILLDDVLALDENNSEALFLRAIIFWRTGRSGDGAGIMEALLKRKPGNPSLERFAAMLKGEIYGEE